MRWAAAPELSWTTWRRWFAWYPVRVEDAWVWLEYVERQPIAFAGYFYRFAPRS